MWVPLCEYCKLSRSHVKKSHSTKGSSPVTWIPRNHSGSFLNGSIKQISSEKNTQKMYVSIPGLPKIPRSPTATGCLFDKSHSQFFVFTAAVSKYFANSWQLWKYAQSLLISCYYIQLKEQESCHQGALHGGPNWIHSACNSTWFFGITY